MALIKGGPGNDTLNGTSNSDELQGLGGNDTLNGKGGNDVLDGGTGADLMSGGAGNDTYWVDDAGDVVSESSGQGTDTVRTTISYTLGANVERIRLEGSASIDATGNSLANQLTGNDGNNVLNGMGGSDSMTGGLGDDTYHVDNSNDAVIEVGSQGTDTVVSSLATYTLGSYTEDLQLVGNAITGNGNSAANTILGNSAANVLRGNAGDDYLDGGEGSDDLRGGSGNDRYVVDRSTDLVSENADNGNDTVLASLDWALGANLENLTLSGNAASGTGNELANMLVGNAQSNHLSGAAGNDSLSGGSGDDTLDGGSGVDTMDGGAGNDFIYVDNTGDLVVEALGGGDDIVQSSVDHTLAAHVEHLIMTGSAGIGNGNALANSIRDTEGNNQIDAGEGDDRVLVGGGADVVVGGLGEDVLVVDYSDAASAVVAESPVGFSHLIGDQAGNSIVAQGFERFEIRSGSGNDRLAGSVWGNDIFRGGAGDDTYIVNNTGDQVIEDPLALVGGIDTIESSIDYVLGAGLENLTLTGNALSGTGNAAVNVLRGNALSNQLDGAAGADTLIGGAGNDYYLVDNTGDMVVEQAGAEGYDEVRSTVDHTLAANVEGLQLYGNAVAGTGNAGMNFITGNALNNVLDGRGGTDFLTGRAGDDTYIVDSAADSITEAAGEGYDTVQSSVAYTLGTNVERLVLTGNAHVAAAGNALANEIVGNGGHNILDGRAGADVMRGGLGSDTYYVDDTADTAVEDAADFANTDTVYSGVDFTLANNIEHLFLTGTAASGTGNAGNNFILGNDGDNILHGMGGADWIQSEAGRDSVYGDSGDDVVFGDVRDALFSGGDGYDSLNLWDDAGTVAALTARLDAIAGVLDFSTTLGEAGVAEGFEAIAVQGDTVGTDDRIIFDYSGSSSDLGISVESSNDGVNLNYELVDGSGRQVIAGCFERFDFIGGSGNDSISGGLGIDHIDGGTGSDVLFGGEGADVLTGGAGVDIFRCEVAQDGTVDLITDFDAAAGDILDLRALTAAYPAFDGAWHQMHFAGGDSDGDGTLDYHSLMANLTGEFDTFVEIVRLEGLFSTYPTTPGEDNFLL
jgi:trimeric autotransporter adhesin